MSHLIIESSTSSHEQNVDINYPIKPEEHYKIIWQQISFETNLLTFKLSILIGSQAFLFGAYISLLNSPETFRTVVFNQLHQLMMWIFPISAFFISSFLYFSMISSHFIILQLRNHYKEYPKDKATANLPTIEIDRKLFFLSNISILVLPAILSIVWLIILIKQWFWNI